MRCDRVGADSFTGQEGALLAADVAKGIRLTLVGKCAGRQLRAKGFKNFIASGGPVTQVVGGDRVGYSRRRRPFVSTAV